MIRNLHKTKIYGFLKGLIDSGLKMKHDKKIFPDEASIKGKHLKEDFTKHFDFIKLKIESGKEEKNEAKEKTSRRKENGGKKTK